MNKNIRIARELLRIAKNFIADDANDHKVDKELFQAENANEAVDVIKTKVSQYVKKDVIDDGFYDEKGYIPEMDDIRTLLVSDLEFDGLGINADLSDDQISKNGNEVDIYVDFTCSYENKKHYRFYMKGRYGCIRHLDKKTYDIYFNIQNARNIGEVQEEENEEEVVIAKEPGYYENFTGKINYKGIQGQVENATFTLKDKGGIDIFWETGIWKTGVWENGNWKSGTWEEGFWKSGYWKTGKDKYKQGHTSSPSLWEIQYNKYTGKIDYMGIKGNVKEATFKTYGKSGKIVWTTGTWQDGVWDNEISIWEYGTWEKGTWNGGLWKDGTWEKGTWNKGTWKDGKWIEGTWNGGTWEKGYDQFDLKHYSSPDTWTDDEHQGKYSQAAYSAKSYDNFTGGIDFGDIKAIVENATFKLVNNPEGKTIIWESGTWKRGFWQDGTWKSGTWEKGIWNKGIWQDGTWIKGIWKGGTWINGKDGMGMPHRTGDSPDEWKYNLETAHKEGEYKNFTGQIDWKGTKATVKEAFFTLNNNNDQPILWEDGTWEDGTWNGGTWEKGTWEKGIWKKGTFYKGIFKTGTWQFGVFRAKNGIFSGDTWVDGYFYDGMFNGATWKNGYFNGGKFIGNTWENGIFNEGATWIKGTWKNGVWRGGIWIPGKESIWIRGTDKFGIVHGVDNSPDKWEFYIASYAGEYKNFTGTIDWMGTKGTVKRARFTLSNDKKDTPIYWSGGTWKDGTWEDGNFDGGTWEKGTWNGGTWTHGTWIEGIWNGGNWIKGKDKEGNEHDRNDSPDKW